MEGNKAKLVAFWDEENILHYGFLLADGHTIVCGDCGGTFDVLEDATVLKSCDWNPNVVESFIQEELFDAELNGSLS